MAQELTLEEAIRNEQGWQEELKIAEQRYSDSPTLFNKIKVADAKSALEFYNGRVEYDYKRDYDGNILYFKREPDGSIKKCTKEEGHPMYDKEAVLKRIPGLIQDLAGEAQRLKKASDLGKRFADRTFDNFDKRGKEDIHKAAWAYAERDDLFNSSKNCLLFLGGVGTGKTHLAAAISNVLIERGIPTLFGTFIDHLQKIKDEFNNTTLDTYLSKMKSTPMLVIDDLGKERKSDWTQQILFDVINYRYEHMLPTIVTSNLNDNDLMNHVGNATASRLNEMSVAIHTIGEDYRRRHK